MWYGLDEKAGTSTPRELCEKILSKGYFGHWGFANNVLKQGRASAKQVSVLCNMINSQLGRDSPRFRSRTRRSSKRNGHGWLDRDEYYDLGYEGHPGEFDGEF